jgi:hypothetical protein
MNLDIACCKLGLEKFFLERDTMCFFCGFVLNEESKMDARQIFSKSNV